MSIKLTESTSLYLDAIRFGAAFLVFWFHVEQLNILSNNTSIVKSSLARYAVMMFFVLSGYVIAFVVDSKENTPSVYFQKRFARLYSVVLPALLLTLILDSIAVQLTPSLYDPNTHQNIIARIGISVLFLNQVWNLTVMPLSNGPFWSVAYEFWYYVIFGVFIFTSGQKRFFYLTLITMIVGPRILLLMPNWLMGVASYYLCKNKKINSSSYAMCIFFIALFFIFTLLNTGSLIDAFVSSLKQANPDGYFLFFGIPFFIGGDFNFLSDYYFSFIFSISLIAFNTAFSQLSINPFIQAVIHYFANHTFSLYLYHVPLLLFYQSFIKYYAGVFPNQIIIPLTLLTIGVLAKYSEYKKYQYFKIINLIYMLVHRKVK